MRFFNFPIIDEFISHEWYAWRPVLTYSERTTSFIIVWLEPVMRKRSAISCSWRYTAID